jgi:putative flippase GtrA
VAELLLTLGVLLLFGKMSPPSDAYSSPAFLALDVSVLGFGVLVAFLINERFTVKEPGRKNGASSSRAARLLKFEGVNAMGNATVIVVQFALFAALSIAPVVGSVVGSIVAYPITYLISMRVVWKPTDAPTDMSLIDHRNPSSRKGGPLSPPVTAIVFLVSLYALGQVLRRRKR